MLEPERLRREVRRKLDDSRYRHSLCVQQRAAKLAAIHGADWYRAAIAGLVHDICHCDPYEQQLKYLRGHDILLDDFTLAHPQIWHAVTGCIYLHEELGVRDKALLRAVRFHTTGRAEMTTLEKVVYLADATSSDRTYSGAEELTRTADEDLNKAMYESLHHTVKKVVDAKAPVVAEAWEALRYYSFWKDIPKSVD